MAKKDLDLSFLKPNAEEFELPSRGLSYDDKSALAKGKIHIAAATTFIPIRKTMPWLIKLKFTKTTTQKYKFDLLKYVTLLISLIYIYNKNAKDY